MTELEHSITTYLTELHIETTTANKTFASVKKALSSSASAVKTVGDLGESLNHNIKENSNGPIGKLGGWMVGKTTKTITDLSSGLVAGSLMTAASVIPDAVSPKKQEIDGEIARIVETYELPSDKNELLETVKYLWENVYEKNSIFGDKTKKSMKTLHDEAYTSLTSMVANDTRLLKIAKNYSPKKKFGLFG